MANSSGPVPTLKLNDGSSIPVLAYGTGTAWYKPTDDGKIDQTLVDSIKCAIKLGYTHLDGAEVYITERELGLAIKESGAERSKLYVVTKVNNENLGNIKGAIKESLRKLQLDYVDLYLIHQPFLCKTDEELQKIWADMEAVQEAGLAKSIGVSNYLINHLESTLKTAKVVPAINQIEFHPYLQHGSLIEFHKKHGIALSAYGPLSAITKGRPGPLDDYLAALAKKYGVSEGEICLRWCIDQDIVAITTSSKEQRLMSYLRVTQFKLTPSEVQEIKDLGDKKHLRVFWNKNFDPEDRS